MKGSKLRPEEAAESVSASSSASKKSVFGAGLALYAWVLLILMSIALVIFTHFLSVYERTRPQHAVDAYLLSLQQQATPAVEAAFSDLDSAICSTEEDMAWVQPLLAEAVLARDPANSTEEQKAYLIRTADHQTIGSVLFAVTAREQYDLPVWEAVEEHFDFSPYYQHAEVTVPPDYSVYLGGKLLGPACIVETDIPYDTLEECYQHYSDLPTKVRYEDGPFVGEAALRVLDEQGRELAPDELTDARFLARCSEEQRSRAEAFVDAFLPVYVRFSSDINGGGAQYYGELLSLVRRDSQLAQQMHMVLQSFGWSNTRASRLLSLSYHNMTDLGDGRLLVDFSYELEITALAGPTVRRDDVQLVLVEDGDSYLADAMYLYDSETYND